MNSSNENKKMEKNALTVFLSLAGIIYTYGLWISFSTGHMLAGGLLIATIILIAGIVVVLNKT
ncbi:MAG: hypothetical protein HYU69_12215 [Bacteroidetes bacterium]|nr:hypothetical protein [Bacteroidota bacterium]